MIENSTLAFLAELDENNTRDWFDTNRKRYEAAKKNITAVVNALIGEITAFDKGVAGLEAKQTMFRIFRDVRFSKNKAPYKTNLGAWIAPGGRKSPYAGYYLHVEPGKSFLAGGSYHPMPAVLKSIREGIDYDAASLRKILEAPKFKKLFPELRGDKVKTSPKGYDKNHPDIDLIRQKDFIVVYDVKDDFLQSPEFVTQAVGIYKTLQPLNAYLNKAIAEAV